MKTRVEEINHKLEGIIKNQSASPTTVRLFETFIDEVTSALEQQGKNTFFRTHKIGVTGFCRPRKGFIFVNLRQDHLSIVCFTGGGNIPGLTKGQVEEIFETVEQLKEKREEISSIVKYWDDVVLLNNGVEMNPTGEIFFESLEGYKLYLP